MNTLALISAMLLSAPADRTQTVIVVVGAAGEKQYAEKFDTWADRWEAAAEKAGAKFVHIGSDEKTSTADRDALKQHLDQAAKQPPQALWLVLIGHGTFDGRKAKLNLRGPDVTAEELAGWLKPVSAPTAVINCTSASGPFINRLSAPNRVIVTATKSGYEHNYARFGDYMSAAIAGTQHDLDKDGQTSLLEAYLAASAGVAEFYRQEARLATEHALLDDNGDALGTPADWFRGYRAVRTAKDGAQPDGLRANQFVLIRSGSEAAMPARVRQRRDELEREVANLRQTKSKLAEDEYYQRLEPLMAELGRLYLDLESAGDGTP